MTSILKVSEIQDPTNGNTVLSIDSSGRVNAPNQPIFQVVGNNNNYINTTPVPFPTVQIDTASGFNASTYIYTIPKAGKWQLTSNLGIVRLGADTLLINYIYKGSTSLGYSYNDTANVSGYTYANSTFTKIVDCAVGDEIKVVIDVSGTSGTYYNGPNECRFSGFLLG
tara:strand:+ start:129 stop:632 length:504 start_codon:yes stop_codon:yes gene_type:complete